MDANVKRNIAGTVKRQVKWDCPLCDYTSFRIGGPADAVVCVDNRIELEQLLQQLGRHELRWCVIGRGTNLLVKDDGYRGVVILLEGSFKHYTVCEKNSDIVINAGAGFGLSRLSSLCMEKAFSGLEFAMGIPGTLGGAVMMNAGAWGCEMADVILSADIMTDKGKKQLSRDDLKFSYRKSEGLADINCIVTSAAIRLKHGDAAEIKALCSSYLKQRDEKQPKGLANAGSIFKNPEGDSAGRLIEASGLKGKKIGDAKVSEKHANFIVNHGNASAEDVLKLIEHIQSKVKKDSGILLVPEVHIL